MKKKLTILFVFCFTISVAQRNGNSKITMQQVDSLINTEKIISTLDSVIEYEQSQNSIGIDLSESHKKYIFISIYPLELRDIYIGDFISSFDFGDYEKDYTCFFRTSVSFINCLVCYEHQNEYDRRMNLIPELTKITDIHYKYYYRDILAEFYIQNAEINYRDTTNKRDALNLLYERHKTIIPKILDIQNLYAETDTNSHLYNPLTSRTYITEKGKYFNFPMQFLSIDASNNYNDKIGFNKYSYHQALTLSNNPAFYNPYFEQINKKDDFVSHPSFFALYVNYSLPSKK